MPRFDYVRARSIDEAVRLLNEPGKKCSPLAGGTDVMVALRVKAPWFDRLVDISQIDELKVIEQRAGKIILGAGVTFTQALENPLLQKTVPFLVQACQSVGGPQVRNAGTLGGNVANAAVCADSLPPLVCLGAVAHLRSAQGERQMPVSELVTGPHRTQIGPGELLTHFSFDLPPEHVRSHFIKIGRRKAQSISRLSMAAMGGLDGEGRVDFVRLTPGAAVSNTIPFPCAEEVLRGQRPEAALLAAAGERVAAKMIELTGVRWSTGYKEVAIKALTERALRHVLN